MLTRPKDAIYCGVNKEKIKSANPKINEENLKHFFNWFTERYKIRIKKDIQRLPPPWTEDPILSKYRFTNVRREHDKETRWLISNIINSELSYENKLLNIILFRLINKSQTFSIFGKLDFYSLDLELIRKNLINFKDKNPSYIYFSNAFFTSGPKTAANKIFSEPNMIIKMILLVDYYRKNQIIDKISLSKNQTEIFSVLSSFPGIGEFLAYQIFVDFSYIKDFPFSENEFVVAGPGCKKGLNYLFESFDGLGYEEALFWLRDNQSGILARFPNYNPQELFWDLPKEERTLNLMSLENSMCEISKYIRAITGKGRPRIVYTSSTP
jgi:hypothetical protein